MNAEQSLKVKSIFIPTETHPGIASQSAEMMLGLGISQISMWIEMKFVITILRSLYAGEKFVVYRWLVTYSARQKYSMRVIYLKTVALDSSSTRYFRI